MPPAAYVLDDLDRSIAARLREDGREPNRSLADALGVNEATIAARLKRLDAAGAMRVTALTDFRGFGFEYFAFALITVADRPATDVARDIGVSANVISVTVNTGRFDVIAALVARTRDELGVLVGETIPRVAGVDRVRCEFAIDVLRFDSAWAALRASGDARDRLPPGPELEVTDTIDELDVAIIRALQGDARASNRKVAAELGISEGTVRARLRRLEGEHLVRIRAVCDVDAFGLTAYATVGVHVTGGRVDRVGRDLAAIDAVGALIRSLGEFDFMLILTGETRSELLATVLEQVQTVRGVRATETFEVATALKHDFSWSRLID